MTSLQRHFKLVMQTIVDYYKQSLRWKLITLLPMSMCCSKVESEKLQQMYESGRDRYTRTLNLQAQMDERELRQVAEDKRTFLKTAVEYYIKTLVAGVGDKLLSRKLFHSFAEARCLNVPMSHSYINQRIYKIPLMNDLFILWGRQGRVFHNILVGPTKPHHIAKLLNLVP